MLYEGAVNKHGVPIILSSDQGSQFTSSDYINLLKQYDIKISMDGKGRAPDNAITERFFRTIKWEDIYIMQYATPKALRQGIDAYIQYYNYERSHQSRMDKNRPMSTMPIFAGSRSSLLKPLAVATKDFLYFQRFKGPKTKPERRYRGA